MDAVKLDGKTVIVTGANTGIGLVTARELARRGARVILACRSAERGEEARREIVESTNNENVVCQILDLASLKSVQHFAQEFNEKETRLDILVNNAGVMLPDRRETADGFEMHFGTNHLGHFYLTYLLLDKLKSSAPSRIVNVSSSGHESAKLDFDDLQLKHSFKKLSSYGKSKTANILHAVHLAKLLEGTGVTTYFLHPGAIRTEIARDFDPRSCYVICCLWIMFKLTCERVLSPEEGAQTTLFCCLEPSIALHSGRYYSEMKEAKAKPHATDPAIAEKLWKISLDLCGITS